MMRNNSNLPREILQALNTIDDALGNTVVGDALTKILTNMRNDDEYILDRMSSFVQEDIDNAIRGHTHSFGMVRTESGEY